MAKYGVEISEAHSIELDVAPNAPALSRIELEWTVPVGELSRRLGELGGREKFSQLGARVWSRIVPLTRDGDRCGTANVKVWAVGEEGDPEVVMAKPTFAGSRGSGR